MSVNNMTTLDAIKFALKFIKNPTPMEKHMLELIDLNEKLEAENAQLKEKIDSQNQTIEELRPDHELSKIKIDRFSLLEDNDVW